MHGCCHSCYLIISNKATQPAYLQRRPCFRTCLFSLLSSIWHRNKEYYSDQKNPPINFDYEVDDSCDNSIRCLFMNKPHGYLRNVIECRFDELLIYGGCLSLFIKFYKYDIHTIFTDDVIFVISKLCLCLSNLHISI